LRRSGPEGLNDLLQDRRRHNLSATARIDVIDLNAEPGGLRA
jgi:hypothetical protein